ncbi:MAG: hypothetical protein RJA98_1972 [Pseudomonadota bacterium]|jgi:hypothetical protein
MGGNVCGVDAEPGKTAKTLHVPSNAETLFPAAGFGGDVISPQNAAAAGSAAIAIGYCHVGACVQRGQMSL